MPAHIHRGQHSNEVSRRQGLLDQANWELQILQEVIGNKKGMASFNTPYVSDSTETKLSVREQARQFEQQAFQEQALKQNRDSHGSLSSILVRDMDSDDMLELTSEALLSIMDYPRSPTSMDRDVSPGFIVAQADESWPLSNQKPTPPVLRKLSSSISNYMTAQPCQITVEMIPDPPENPAPPPPSNLHSHPPSPPTSPPPAPPFGPPPGPPSPPFLHKPQRTTLSSPPLVCKPLAPPPPPPLPPPSPINEQPRPVIQFVPTTLPPLSSLRPVSERKLPPPLTSSETDLGTKKELKGILKNIQNLAEIERSIANLYNQVDKNSKVPKFNKKPQVTEESDCANKRQSSDPGEKQSSPKMTNSASEVQVDSTSMNGAENGVRLNPAEEFQETNELNTDSSIPAEHCDFSSQSTVF